MIEVCWDKTKMKGMMSGLVLIYMCGHAQPYTAL